MIEFAAAAPLVPDPAPVPSSALTFAALLALRARYARGVSVRALASLDRLPEAVVAWACAGVRRDDGTTARAPGRYRRIPLRDGGRYGRPARPAPASPTARARMGRLARVLVAAGAAS